MSSPKPKRLRLKDLAAGQRYLWVDETDGKWYPITIVGYDPIHKQWVASSKSWCMGISHITGGDLNRMRAIK